MLKIQFNTDNAAFIDPNAVSDWGQMYYRNEEIKRVLKNICNQLDNEKKEGACIDINGNKIGEWSIN